NDHQQPDDAEHGRRHTSPHDDPVEQAATPEKRRVHLHQPLLRSMRLSIRRAIANTMNVMTNSRKPRASNAERCSPPASGNWLAISAAIDGPCPATVAVKNRLLPITNVTAMVSPNALPRPRITPPTMPARTDGKITLRTTSQVVQPSPYADSRNMGGTVIMTSRVMAVMIGISITATINPAVVNPVPAGKTVGNRVLRNGASTSTPHMPKMIDG